MVSTKLPNKICCKDTNVEKDWQVYWAFKNASIQGCFMMRVTMCNSETPGCNRNWLRFWLLPPWLPLPRCSPMGLRIQGLHPIAARQDRCRPEDPSLHALDWEVHKHGILGCQLSTDHLTDSMKPKSFLILLKQNHCGTYMPSSSPKHILSYSDSFSLTQIGPYAALFTSGPGPADWSLHSQCDRLVIVEDWNLGSVMF